MCVSVNVLSTCQRDPCKFLEPQGAKKILHKSPGTNVALVSSMTHVWAQSVNGLRFVLIKFSSKSCPSSEVAELHSWHSQRWHSPVSWLPLDSSGNAICYNRLADWAIQKIFKQLRAKLQVNRPDDISCFHQHVETASLFFVPCFFFFFFNLSKYVL